MKYMSHSIADFKGTVCLSSVKCKHVHGSGLESTAPCKFCNNE